MKAPGNGAPGIPQCNVTMTGDAPSLSRSSGGFSVPCCGCTFLTMDTFLNNRDPSLASSKLLFFFFSDDSKGSRVVSCG